MQAPVDRTVVSTDGTAIAVTDVGSGPAVVVVGGAFGHRGTPFVEEVVQGLAAGRRVITYDRRGRGDSGDTAPWSIEREVDDLRAVVASADGPVTVASVCVGAGVVLHALASGLPADAAVLWEPPYRASVDPHADDVVFADTLDEHVAAGRRATAVRAFLGQVLGLPMGQVSAYRLRPALWRSFLADADVLARDVRMLNGLAIPERTLAAVGVPVVVGCGTESAAWLGLAARATAEAIPGSELVVVPGEDHSPRADTLDRLLTRVRELQP
ncbi:alpha/beta fold hydrolase [Curtobacterium sp. 9128]|uniref:alpha/beta fold hydrolase n=1 Tax=Curtobacterium sp. 9128 TaxID=1793722 RepID=UPI0011A533AC|nr:alpha/beta hydrolase [Curtobacterium sp. 9128]